VGVYHLRGSHLRQIARHHAKHSLRGGTGLVFTFLSLLVGLLIANAFISPVESSQKQAAEIAKQLDQKGVSDKQILDALVEDIGKPAIKWWVDADADQLNYLVYDKPAVVSAILVVLLFSAPFLIAFGAFNQTTGDIQHKGLRYLLLRTERSNIFIGRFLGTYIFSLFVMALLMLVVWLYLVIKTDFYPKMDVTLWMLQGYVALAIFCLPYVALCAWLSGATDSPFVSLIVSSLFIGFWPLLIYLGAKMESAVAYGNYAMPWGFKYHLLHPNLLHTLGAAGAMFGFTALFVWVGLRHFQTRDL
jgi:hypothetical protein